MIEIADVDFHDLTRVNYDWCETNFFPFSIPEARIFGGCYALTRPKLGVCMSDISIFDRISSTWGGQLYVDNRQHLPLFETFFDYTLPNGLAVKILEPLQRYQVDYTGEHDTELHLHYRSLMKTPWDMNDPNMCPLAARRQRTDWDLGGHYEITCRVTGSARIRGKDYRVDCVNTLDRSWSARSEGHHSPCLYFNASFGEALTIHAIVMTDLPNAVRFGKLYSGFVFEDGEIYGIAAARGDVDFDGTSPRGMVLEVTDVRGKTFAMTGSAVNYGPWAPFPSNVWHTGMMRYNLAGRIGYGYHQHSVSMSDLTRLRDTLGAR